MVVDPATRSDATTPGGAEKAPSTQQTTEEPTTHVLRRGIVFDRLKVFFVPVPKAGCTSLLWLLARASGLTENVFAESGGREVTRALSIHDIWQWPDAFRFGKRPPEDRDRILADEEWFRFTVVRHPFRRLWSAWQSKILLAEPQFYDLYSSQEWFPRELRSADDVVTAWRNFLNALQADPQLVNADVHWAPQVDVAEQSRVTYSHVGHVEELAATLSPLRDHVRNTIGLELADPPRTNLSLLPYTDDLYTEETVRFVGDMYAGDMRAFSYDPPESASEDKLPEAWMETVEAVVPAIEELRNRHERVADLQSVAKGRKQQLRKTEQSVRREQKLRREEHRRNQRLQQRLRQTTNELQRMRSSRTWRYTAPIRTVGRKIRRMKRGRRESFED